MRLPIANTSMPSFLPCNRELMSKNIPPKHSRCTHNMPKMTVATMDSVHDRKR